MAKVDKERYEQEMLQHYEHEYCQASDSDDDKPISSQKVGQAGNQFCNHALNSAHWQDIDLGTQQIQKPSTVSVILCLLMN